MDGICIYCKKILRDISKNICEDCENNKLKEQWRYKMNKELIVKILADRVKAVGITLEQVPQAYRADVQALLEQEVNNVQEPTD